MLEQNAIGGSPLDKWMQMEQQMSDFVDEAGVPIDDKIRLVVVGLVLTGFDTSSSCAGGITGHDFERGPFVQIDNNLGEKLFAAEEKVRREVAIRMGNRFTPLNPELNFKARLVGEKTKEWEKADKRFALRLFALLQ